MHQSRIARLGFARVDLHRVDRDARFFECRLGLFEPAIRLLVESKTPRDQQDGCRSADRSELLRHLDEAAENHLNVLAFEREAVRRLVFEVPWTDGRRVFDT